MLNQFNLTPDASSTNINNQVLEIFFLKIRNFFLNLFKTRSLNGTNLTTNQFNLQSHVKKNIFLF